MRSIRAVIRRHPALSFYVLTFVISWGAILPIIASTGLFASTEDFNRTFPIALVLLVLGPSVSGVLMTWLVDGRQGLRAYRARLLRWRVAPRWYAIALLTAPLYFLAVGLGFATVSRDYMPGVFVVDHTLSYVMFGMMTAFVAGIVEELGWTGFAIPTLRRRHSALSTGLIVGGLWGFWHVLPKIWGAEAHGLVPYLPIDLGCALVGLTGYRILMVWVYDRTQSLFIGILMHMGLTASTLILQPNLLGAAFLPLGIVLALVPWLIVAAMTLRAHHRGGALHPSIATS